jgi:hypothetical protein
MKKRKPKPGSKPLKFVDAPAREPDGFDPLTVLPPWYKTEESKQFARDYNLSALGKARAKVEELAGDVRSDAFDDWVQRCVVTAQVPSEWTQARILYENYLAHVKTYGQRAAHRALSIQEAATETGWGRMMATLFLKKRRTAGWYYPLRCKGT